MKKANFIGELKEKTNRAENECIIINDVLENHFVVGKNNEEKIIKDFIKKLNIEYTEADELYSIYS